MRSILTLVLFAQASALGAAERLVICLDNRAELPAAARLEMRAELRMLLVAVPIKFLDGGECPPPSAAAIRVALLSPAPLTPENVFGAAPIRGGKIAPDLAVYPAAVAAFTGARDWRKIGRALGRVAAHEVAHYLLQQCDHEEQGLLRDRFSARQLTSEDSRHEFRLSAGTYLAR